ncbi:hypothetical protein [Sorlinia euscelidii]|uniref:hypothetical protein n=1 Tax=Sorlinia euscelidii TaxID=3081148 RepID=UPI00374E1DBA
MTIGKSPEKPDMPPAGTRAAKPKNITMADLGLGVVALDEDLRKSTTFPIRSAASWSYRSRLTARQRNVASWLAIHPSGAKVEIDSPAAFAHEIDRLRDQKKNIILILLQSKDGISWVPLTLHQALRESERNPRRAG